MLLSSDPLYIHDLLNVHKIRAIFFSVVSADNFIAKYISFRNTSGPRKHQAVALRSSADKCAFYKCSFIGYQDTLFANYGRQFFRDCNIHGTVDFIFGDAAAILQNCKIVLGKPLAGQANVITAQGREDVMENTGIVIHRCRITTAEDFHPGLAKCYLGRPWKKYSRTVVMKTYIHEAIEPCGWIDMNNNHGTAECIEYGNYGPRAATRNRVQWPGFKVLKTAKEAKPYTTEVFINGFHWLPSTGIPFTSGT